MTYINDINSENRYAYGRREYSQGNTVSGDQVTDSGVYPQNSVPGYAMESLTVAKLRAGTITSKQVNLEVQDGAGDVFFAGGKTDFTTTENGFIMGIDDSDSNLPKWYIGNATDYIYFNGVNSFFSGTITVGSFPALPADTNLAGY